MTDGWATGTAGGFISVGDDGPEGVVVRDHNIPGLWGRLTAEPRAGWYSWQTAVPKADGTFETMPAEQPYLYGTAHASDPAQDNLPARGANGEAGLTAGATTGRVVWLEFEPGGTYRFAVGGGSGSVVVYTLAANAGTAWTPAVVVSWSATGGLVAAGEVVDVQPLTDPLANGQAYFATDTGARSPGTNRRRLRTERAGGGGAAPNTITLTLYRYDCAGGSLRETPYTVTLTAPGLTTP